MVFSDSHSSRIVCWLYFRMSFLLSRTPCPQDFGDFLGFPLLQICMFVVLTAQALFYRLLDRAMFQVLLTQMSGSHLNKKKIV